MLFWIRAASDKRNFWIERLHHAFVASESKSVLWCTCFWVDGLGAGKAKIVPAAAKGWFLELVLMVVRDLFFQGFLVLRSGSQ